MTSSQPEVRGQAARFRLDRQIKAFSHSRAGRPKAAFIERHYRTNRPKPRQRSPSGATFTPLWKRPCCTIRHISSP